MEKKTLAEKMELITRLFIAAAKEAQEARDRLRLGIPWCTDELVDGCDDGEHAVKLLRELL